ncbi:MAG: hypothetical protein IPM45_18060 [Acidimicrobiales bacterium]|nr:hypothetical protein [Acidimicrobiales bacterium]
MASDFYQKGLEHFCQGDIDWLNDDIKVALVDSGAYTVDLAADEYLDDIAGAAIVATSDPLVDKTCTLGVLDAADVTIEDVTGSTVEKVLIYKDTGNAATSILLLYGDGVVTPNGSDVLISFPASGNKIGALG